MKNDWTYDWEILKYTENLKKMENPCYDGSSISFLCIFKN